jgi:ribosomal protein S15
MPAENIFIPNAEDEAVPSRPPAEVNVRLSDGERILSSENTGVAMPHHLNDFITPEELSRFTELSRAMTAPIPSSRAVADPEAEAEAKAKHDEEHATRTAALARIFAVENTNSRSRTSINIRRMIDEFGRHNTDSTIDPRQLLPKKNEKGELIQRTKERIGPDTGSSEVQIAILTAKIRLMAREYQGRSKNDKHNKRNLRVLMHRRQRLLRYFYRRDKGGERWQHMVEKLGITPAMWQGEIELR